MVCCIADHKRITSTWAISVKVYAVSVLVGSTLKYAFDPAKPLSSSVPKPIDLRFWSVVFIETKASKVPVSSQDSQPLCTTQTKLFAPWESMPRPVVVMSPLEFTVKALLPTVRADLVPLSQSLHCHCPGLSKVSCRVTQLKDLISCT